MEVCMGCGIVDFLSCHAHTMLHLQHVRRPDFANPTPELIAHAKESGIDLTDETQRKLLVEMQRQREREAEAAEKGEALSHTGPPEEGIHNKNRTFWITFWIVFAVAGCRILYVMYNAPAPLLLDGVGDSATHGGFAGAFHESPDPFPEGL